MNKKIANVVFYKFWDPTREDAMQQACIFYEDGTVKNTLYEEGLEAAYELANAEKISGKQFRTMLNNKKIFTMSGEEFERRFQEFVMVSKEMVKAAVDTQMQDVDALKKTAAPTITSKPVTKTPKVATPVILPVSKDEAEKVVTPGRPVSPVVPKKPTKTATTPVPEQDEEEEAVVTPVVPVTAEANPATPKTKAEKAAETENKKKKKKKEKKDSLWQRFKKSKVGKRVTALAVAAALALGLGTGYHLGKNSKDGKIINNNISLLQVDDDIVEPQDVTYLNLLKETKNEDLKEFMTKQGENLDMYNRDFAAAYIEEGKDVKAALSWDEMIALNLAYNDYTKDQIRVMFNGAEVDSLAMSHAYKNATLQLMGAYVISDRDNPVNIAALVTSEEGKSFVQKYEDMFYACKEATGDERVAAVNAFYAELFKDFPISDEVREEGLSHADARKSVKNYMAAVTPMVAAAEIMWQNLEIDHTLSDKATAYFNDIGICNIAEDAFERAESITLMSETDETLPTYHEFMNAKIEELTIEGNYVIDDAHRDLSQLDEFQKWVNGNFVFDENGNNTGVISYTETTTSTYTETTYSTETTSTTTQDRDEAVNAAGEDAVKEAEEKVDQAINEENEQAKAEAEEKAEETRQELQEEADREAEELEEEVRQDAEDFQENIDDANETIDNGGTVNEDDLGHGTNFDDEHSDGNGNLDDSVSDITTDGTGAVDATEPLPDPNEMGEMFDQGITNPTETTDSTSEDYFDEGVYSYEEPYYGGTEMTNEQIVDAMIASMEAEGGEYESSGVYTK